jgi:hypothetical protein
MKFTLAIAFALLLATAYGFRVKTTEDTCSDYTYEYDNCTYVDTWCSAADGSSYSTNIGTCVDGNTTSNTCDYSSSWDEATGSVNAGHCDSTKCEGGAPNCDTCTDNWNGSWSADGQGVDYSTSSCTFANGTISGKLAYFI